jgi:hypothetical protein
MDRANIVTLDRRDQASDATASPPEAARTLQARANYLLSESGRKTALLMSGNGRARQHIVVEVPVHRLHLVNVDPQGRALLKLQPRYEVNDGGQVVRVDAPPIYDHPPTVEELFLAAAQNHELERTYQVQRAASPKTQRRQTERQRRLDAAQAFLADPAQRALLHPPPSPHGCYLITGQGRLFFDAKRDVGPARQVPGEAHRRFQCDERERRKRSAQLKAEQLALHEEKKRFIAEWIDAHGTPEQKVRQAAGVLPIKEAIDTMADIAFAPAREFPRYERDGVATFQEHLQRFPQYANVAVTRGMLTNSDTEAQTATATQWERLQAIRSALPDAEVALRVHRFALKRDTRAPALSFYSVLAVSKIGPISIRRDFAAEG